jgi:hypothetical protein
MNWKCIHQKKKSFIPPPGSAEETDEETDLIDKAGRDHVVKLPGAELEKMRASDERYDAKFTVLAESLKHHIKEEEEELFPKLEGHLDGEKLREKMIARKEQLQQRPVASAKSQNGKSNARSPENKRRQNRRGKRRGGMATGRR